MFELFFSALVWGSSVKHFPQKVGREHVLNDEDVVQVIKKWVIQANVGQSPDFFVARSNKQSLRE